MLPRQISARNIKPNWRLENKLVPSHVDSNRSSYEFQSQFSASDVEAALECRYDANLQVVKPLAVQFASSGEDSSQVIRSVPGKASATSKALRLIPLGEADCPCLCKLAEARRKVCPFLHLSSRQNAADGTNAHVCDYLPSIFFHGVNVFSRNRDVLVYASLQKPDWSMFISAHIIFEAERVWGKCFFSFFSMQKFSHLGPFVVLLSNLILHIVHHLPCSAGIGRVFIRLHVQPTHTILWLDKAMIRHVL